MGSLIFSLHLHLPGKFNDCSKCVILVQHVRFREERMNRNSGDNTNNLSIKVYWQGIWYVAAFMFSWVPWYLWQVSLSKISQTLPIILWKLLSLTGSV